MLNLFFAFFCNCSLRRRNHTMITQKCQTIFDIHISNQKENGSIPFDTLWKNKWKIHISIVFFHYLSENQLHFWRNGKWENYEFLKLFISCVFVKESNFVFSYSSMLYFDSLKGFRLFIVDTSRRNIYFIRNKSSSFVIYIVEWHYGVILNSNLYRSSCLLDWLRPFVDSIIPGFSRPVMKVSNLDTIEFIFNFISFYWFCIFLFILKHGCYLDTE